MRLDRLCQWINVLDPQFELAFADHPKHGPGALLQFLRCNDVVAQ